MSHTVWPIPNLVVGDRAVYYGPRILNRHRIGVPDTGRPLKLRRNKRFTRLRTYENHMFWYPTRLPNRLSGLVGYKKYVILRSMPPSETLDATKLNCTIDTKPIVKNTTQV